MLIYLIWLRKKALNQGKTCMCNDVTFINNYLDVFKQIKRNINFILLYSYNTQLITMCSVLSTKNNSNYKIQNSFNNF